MFDVFVRVLACERLLPREKSRWHLWGYNGFLGFFQKDNINLTKIESRPSKEDLGKYLFFVDFEGHKDDKVIGNILDEISQNTYFFKVLGSYPKFK